MKNCKNKFCFLPRVAVAMVARSFIALVVFVCAVSVSSWAQQNAPVNLLTIAPVDENAHSPDSPSNIDQAIDQALETDGSIKKPRDKEHSGKIVKPARVGEVITSKPQEAPSLFPPAKMLSRPMPKVWFKKTQKAAVMKLLP